VGLGVDGGVEMMGFTVTQVDRVTLLDSDIVEGMDDYDITISFLLLCWLYEYFFFSAFCVCILWVDSFV